MGVSIDRQIPASPRDYGSLGKKWTSARYGHQEISNRAPEPQYGAFEGGIAEFEVECIVRPNTSPSDKSRGVVSDLENKSSPPRLLARVRVLTAFVEQGALGVANIKVQ